VIHRLPRDEGQPLVDGDLGQLGVLDGVRPNPQDLSVAKAGHVLQGGFGQQHHVGGRDDLLTRVHAGDHRGEMVVGDAVAVAVAVLEDDPRPQVGIDPVEVSRADG